MSSLAQPCPCKHGRGFAPFVNKTAICCLFSQTFSSSSLTSTDDEYLVLKEYPVRKIISVFALFHFGQPAIIETDFYKIAPDEKDREDIPYTIILSPAILRLRSLAAYRVIYRAGYSVSSEQLAVSSEERRNTWNVPADLKAACLELAAWNMNRYRGRRIGLTGNIKGSGKEGEHFEMSMPENVRALLEPYKRRMI